MRVLAALAILVALIVPVQADEAQLVIGLKLYGKITDAMQTFNTALKAGDGAAILTKGIMPLTIAIREYRDTIEDPSRYGACAVAAKSLVDLMFATLDPPSETRTETMQQHLAAYKSEQDECDRQIEQ